nr:immunoglobulin heavy chain junction region [Mus musculus]
CARGMVTTFAYW